MVYLFLFVCSFFKKDQHQQQVVFFFKWAHYCTSCLDFKCSVSNPNSVRTGPKRESFQLQTTVLLGGQNVTSRQSQTLEPIQDKSKTLNPQAQINPNWLSKASPVNEDTVFAIPFFLRAVFCSFSRPEIIAVLFHSATGHPRRNSVTNPHIAVLKKSKLFSDLRAESIPIVPHISCLC